jgi:Cu2+-exporting ATPase
VPAESGFCCAGCAYVYRLIHEQGLQSYYELKDDVTAPADTALLPVRDYDWLAAAQAEAEQDAARGSHAPELALDVQGISCAGCVWLIDRLFHRQPGAGRIEINAPAGQMRLKWEPPAAEASAAPPPGAAASAAAGQPGKRGQRFDAAAFARVLQSFNYLVAPASGERADDAAAHPDAARPLVRRIGVCAAIAMNTMLFSLPVYFGMDDSFAYARLFGTLAMALGTLSLLAGGGYFIGRAARSLAAGVMSIDLPVALGVAGAYAGSLAGWLLGEERFVYFDFVSTFILLMLVGRWAQVAAVERNRRRLLGRQPAPPRIRVRDADGGESDRPPSSLRAGQVFTIGAGQTVPVNARLLSPLASVSLAWINGEAAPREFRAGQVVPAGAASLGRAPLELRAAQDWRDSLLERLLRPAERAEFRNRFFERIVTGYLAGILALSLLGGIVWWLRSGDLFATGAVVIAVLVVSCPCAIGLSFPLADDLAAVALRRRGVFVRVADLWPRIARVGAIIFDKTGTLTLETPVLLNPGALDALDAEARHALLALARDNQHPVSRCLHEAMLLRGWSAAPDTEVSEEIGRGVRAGEWFLGREDAAGQSPDGAPPAGEKAADAATILARGGRVAARFYFADRPRDGARDEIRALQARGLRVAILSGDHPAKVAALAAGLGLAGDAAHGGLSPDAKARWLAARAAAAGTLMLGDGANDSLAFDQALCRGTPVVHRGVLEQKADFYYLGRGIGGIRALFETNDARRRAQRWLLIFSVAYNITAVSLALAGRMSPLLAAVLMPASSLSTLAIVGAAMRRVRGA